VVNSGEAIQSFFATPRLASRPASSTPATGRSAGAAGTARNRHPLARTIGLTKVVNSGGPSCLSKTWAPVTAPPPICPPPGGATRQSPQAERREPGGETAERRRAATRDSGKPNRTSGDPPDARHAHRRRRGSGTSLRRPGSGRRRARSSGGDSVILRDAPPFAETGNIGRSYSIRLGARRT
jgi:hypothetical protein